ncbi:MAG: NADPH:quinone oxidoreductase family protein [Parvibaculales bacterium]
MRALRITDLLPDFGGCHLQQIDPPKAAAGQIVIKVRAATLGFPDLLMTHGGYQMKPELPFTLGMEFAGEVVECGDDVTDFAVNDRVVSGGFLGGTGGFAEFALGQAATARKIPDNLDFAQAAALGTAYLTAYVGLVRCGALQKGEYLLVHGAAGGVGLAALDLGRHLGAKLIATASSSEKMQVIADKYAPEAVLNVGDGFREKVKSLTDGGADVIYDPVGGDVFDESVRCIGWGGRLLVIGFASGRIAQIGTNMPLIKGFSVVGVRAGEFGRRNPKLGAQNQNIIWQLAAKGAINPHVHKMLPLADWREAFAMMENRQVIGRVLLDPSA